MQSKIQTISLSEKCKQLPQIQLSHSRSMWMKFLRKHDGNLLNWLWLIRWTIIESTWIYDNCVVSPTEVMWINSMNRIKHNCHIDILSIWCREWISVAGDYNFPWPLMSTCALVNHFKQNSCVECGSNFVFLKKKISSGRPCSLSDMWIQNF